VGAKMKGVNRYHILFRKPYQEARERKSGLWRKNTILILTLSSTFVLFITSFTFAADHPAEWEGWEQAEEIVRKLPCSEGGTIDQYLTKKADIPAMEDLGWHVYPRKDGFEVERMLLLDQRMSLLYKWHVDKSGKAKPLNGKAIGITKEKVVTKQSNSTFKESYKDWQPYKDYLRLPDSYHSPAMEKSYKDSYEAEKIVKNLPCSKGGTLDQYFSKKPKPPLEDLGWNEFPGENGIDVVRTFLLNPSESLETLEYKWHVDSTGKVKAINGKAIDITSDK
jgi:hypothetical protein